MVYTAQLRFGTKNTCEPFRRKSKSGFQHGGGLYIHHLGELVDDIVRVLKEAVKALSNLLIRWTGAGVCPCEARWI